MTESNDSAHTLAHSESDEIIVPGTDKKNARRGRAAKLSRPTSDVSVDPECLRAAESITLANDLPLPRVLAIALAATPLYQGKLNDPAHKVGVPDGTVDIYNELVGAARRLGLRFLYEPGLLDVVCQLSASHVARLRNAISEIDFLGLATTDYDPYFLELRSSLEMIAAFFTFIHGTPSGYWYSENGYTRRFLADVQRACGSEVREEHLIRCWRFVTRDPDAIFRKALPVVLTRAEEDELKAWRRKHRLAGAEST